MSRHPRRAQTIEALGAVFGNIGTSPLYAFKETLTPPYDEIQGMSYGVLKAGQPSQPRYSIRTNKVSTYSESAASTSPRYAAMVVACCLSRLPHPRRARCQ